MEHIGIAYQDTSCAPYGSPLTFRCIPIICPGLNGQRSVLYELVGLGQLIMGKSLGWKKIQRSGTRIREKLIDNWYGIT
jgi:hypothetical protein